MIEVHEHGNGYRWRWLSGEGRELLAAAETFPCTFTAWADARARRVAFWAFADVIDHRQARAI